MHDGEVVVLDAVVVDGARRKRVKLIDEPRLHVLQVHADEVVAVGTLVLVNHANSVRHLVNHYLFLKHSKSVNQ